jgi:hypothetical protein
VEVSRQSHEGFGDILHKSVVGNQSRKLGSPVEADMLGVEVLERAISGLVEADEEGKDFGEVESSFTFAFRFQVLEGSCLQGVLKKVAEGVDMTEEFE